MHIDALSYLTLYIAIAEYVNVYLYSFTFYFIVFFLSVFLSLLINAIVFVLFIYINDCQLNNIGLLHLYW